MSKALTVGCGLERWRIQFDPVGCWLFYPLYIFIFCDLAAPLTALRVLRSPNSCFPWLSGGSHRSPTCCKWNLSAALQSCCQRMALAMLLVSPGYLMLYTPESLVNYNIWDVVTFSLLSRDSMHVLKDLFSLSRPSVELLSHSPRRPTSSSRLQTPAVAPFSPRPSLPCPFVPVIFHLCKVLGEKTHLWVINMPAQMIFFIQDYRPNCGIMGNNKSISTNMEKNEAISYNI